MQLIWRDTWLRKHTQKKNSQLKRHWKHIYSGEKSKKCLHLTFRPRGYLQPGQLGRYEKCDVYDNLHRPKKSTNFKWNVTFMAIRATEPARENTKFSHLSSYDDLRKFIFWSEQKIKSCINLRFVIGLPEQNIKSLLFNLSRKVVSIWESLWFDMRRKLKVVSIWERLLFDDLSRK